MARIIILNTCDEWKSYASFQLYGTWATTKASCRRLYKTIIEGIKDGISYLFLSDGIIKSMGIREL